MFQQLYIAGKQAILTDRGWLTLWHGVEPKEIVGIYRTYWSILDKDDPSRTLYTHEAPLLEANPELTRPIEHQMYVRDVVSRPALPMAATIMSWHRARRI